MAKRFGFKHVAAGAVLAFASASVVGKVKCDDRCSFELSVEAKAGLAPAEQYLQRLPHLVPQPPKEKEAAQHQPG